MFTKNENSKETMRAGMAVLVLAIVSIVLYCFSEGISGNDFWWHIKVGEWIVQNNTVPTTDIFSWYGTANNFQWTAHEWLADTIFYLLYSTFGAIGIFIFCLVLALIMIFLMFAKAKKYIERNFLIGGLFFAFFAILTSLFFYGRPHIFSYLLLFFELFILYDFQNKRESKKIYFIPFLAVLWSNLHGGSSNLSYILCLIFIIANLFSFNIGRVEAIKFEKREMIKLVLVTALTVVSLMINPIGPRVLSYPYINLSDTLSMSVISEWQSPDAKLIGNLILYFFPIVIMSIGIFCESEKKVALIDVLVMLGFLFLFFRSARFITLWYIAAPFYAFKYVPLLKIKAITKTSEKIAIYTVFCLLFVPIGTSIATTCDTYKEDTLISHAVSNDIIEVVKDNNPQRIFNDYNLGETLIYNDIPVFFDARADLYSQDSIMSDGVSLMYLEQVNSNAITSHVDVNGLIRKYQFDAILILKSRPLYTYLISHSDQFVMVYESDEVGYFRIVGGQDNE